MNIRELKIPDAYAVTPVIHRDERGVFLEWFRFDLLGEAIGRPLDVRQANVSVSSRGTVRGIHYAAVPPGQAKFVTVMSGAVLDFVVDLRVGSPTFGEWDSVVLDDDSRRGVYIAEGLGHGFVVLSESATVSYLVSETYSPEREHSVSPLDAGLGLDLPGGLGEPTVSERDRTAPSLAQAEASGLLPSYADALALYESNTRRVVELGR